MPRKPKYPNPDGVSKGTLKMRLLKRLKCTTRFERELWCEGAQLVAGVDEVGRGALFGPVVAGAVILQPDYRIKGLRDSKLLPAERREVLAERIKEHCIAWSIAAVDVARIDQLNIYHATRLAMTEAVQALRPQPDCLLIDAMKLNLELRQKAIIHGDALSASIAAASIVAKVARDEMIRAWDPIYPAYKLASNKGYRSPAHIKALNDYGPSPLHRQSFYPVWNATSPQEVMEFMQEAKARECIDEPGDEQCDEDEVEALLESPTTNDQRPTPDY